MEKISIILGPTGIGKSAYAVDLAQKTGAEIISADAYQVYQHFDIGTGKVTSDEMAGIPHHLIDIIEPTHPYDVVQFQSQTNQIIQNKPDTPIIICGGTAYYLMAFLYNYDFSKSPESDPKIRDMLEERLNNDGKETLLEELKQIDPAMFQKIDADNPRRLIRALEIYHLTGQPPSSFKIEGPLRTDCHIIGLTTERDKIYDKINRRVDHMIELGLIEEVEELLNQYPQDAPAFQALGYKQCIDYLQGTCDKDSMIDQIKTLTRRFAKRQLTWFKRLENVNWIKTT